METAYISRIQMKIYGYAYMHIYKILAHNHKYVENCVPHIISYFYLQINVIVLVKSNKSDITRYGRKCFLCCVTDLVIIFMQPSFILIATWHQHERFSETLNNAVYFSFAFGKQIRNKIMNLFMENFISIYLKQDDIYCLYISLLLIFFVTILPFCGYIAFFLTTLPSLWLYFLFCDYIVNFLTIFPSLWLHLYI